MKPMDLLKSLGNVKDSYVISAEEFRQGKQRSQPRQLSLNRVWLIAAAIILSLLLVGCAVVYVLSLQDMAFGEKVQEYYDGSSQERTLLSLQGVEGTPGYQATKEWYEWLETYDTDGAVRYSDEAFSEDFGDDYYAYNLYSREMKDKVDEICNKYGLELLGKMYVDPDAEAGCKALQIQGIFRPGVQAEADWGNIRYYENGSFDLEGHMILAPGESSRIVSYSCHRKDAFSELYASVGPEGTYEEWTYTTSDGVDVLMVLEEGSVGGHAFMIVDRGPYVFLFSTNEFEDMPLPDKAGLEAFAEVFDFTVEPQRIAQEELEKAEERREEADKQFAEDYNKMLAGYTEKGYDSRIKFQMENSIHPDQLGFTLMDIDGNGVDDLLVGEHGYLRAAYTLIDDGTQHMIMQRLLYENVVGYDDIGTYSSIGANNMYLCQDGTLAFAYETVDGIIGYHFAKPQGGKLVWSEQIQYDPVHFPDNPWVQRDEDYDDSPITEERFNEIAASHVRKPVDLFPVSEFPLTDDSPSGIGIPDETYDTFDDLVRSRTDWDRDRSDWFFTRMDFDGDGTEELIWVEGAWKGVLTMADGQVKLLACGEDFYICDGNIISVTRNYLGGNKVHCYYKVENGNAILVDYLRYDADKNPENPWMRSTDASGQDVSMVPISEAEFDSVQALYPRMKLEMKSVAQYPLTN